MLAVVGHELTGCVSTAWGGEECPPEGAAFLWIYLLAENAGDPASPAVEVPVEVVILCRGEAIHPQWISMPEGRTEWKSGDLYPGASTSGWEVFVVPQGVDISEVMIQVRLSWEDTATWALEGGQVAGVPSPTPTPTSVPPLKLGEWVEREGFAVNVRDYEVARECLGAGAGPAAGAKLVYVWIVVQNVGEEVVDLPNFVVQLSGVDKTSDWFGGIVCSRVSHNSARCQQACFGMHQVWAANVDGQPSTVSTAMQTSKVCCQTL